MRFSEVVDQAIEFLRRRERVSYRVLKREFDLDDEALEDLKAELIDAQRIAADEDGKVLVWTGEATKGETAKRGNGEKEVVSAQLSVVSPQPPTPSTQHPAERRQLTVMFIDLVGSTTLSQHLDPEDYHARVVAYQAACRQIIARYEGHVAQYLGDGVLVYFGYPAAHEEDAVRAVRSGLEIVTAVSQLAYTPLLQVRIGVHTGPVVVGEIGAGERTERLALGETPNIAARVQGHAAPNEVLISTTTFRLIHGLFETEERGPQELKGISIPMTLYRVVGESTAQSRFEATVQTGLTPLVGRVEELALLQRRWDQVKAGEGQVVLLSGEPGIGKSRLVQELKEHVITEGAIRIEFRCSPYHQNSALYPITNHLQRLLQFAREDSPTVKLEKLQHTLSHYRFPQADTLSLLAALLSLPHPEGYPPLTMSPQKQKEKTQATLVAWLVEEAEQNPVYNTWEDLHWADPSTLEVLTILLDQVPTIRLLVLLTFRPEFTPPWGNRSHLSQLTLSRLSRTQVHEMVSSVANQTFRPSTSSGRTELGSNGGRFPVRAEPVEARTVLSSEIVQQIVAKTDGVPLFVEELTKTVVEQNVGAYCNTPLLGIPSTLQDALMARLDRLAPVKEIAQLGATMGREFSYELLHAVSPLDEDSLQQGLRQLVEVELLYQRGLPPQATYLFKHALIQDTAYQSLLKSKRQHYHQRIAQVLEGQFPDTAETQPELVAHHYTEAGLIAQAIPYWQRAGQGAIRRSANVEAVNHLTRGLQLLETLPDVPQHTQLEFGLQTTLGPALMATKGFAAPEVVNVYTRARTLCQQVGDSPQLFSALLGLVNYYNVRGEFQTGHELGEQLLGMAQRLQDSALLLEAHHVVGGGAVYYFGDLVTARAHLQQALALYNPHQHRSHAFLYGHDPRVCCLCFEAHALWRLGYPDQALKSMQDALTFAQELGHPFSLGQALTYAAGLHQHRREVQATHRWAAELIELSREQGFLIWFPLGTAAQGWVLAEQGDVEEGIAKLRQGIDAYKATQAELGQPDRLRQLAAAYGKAGRTKEGLRVLTEAWEVVSRTGERLGEAELYRLKGELTLQQFNVHGSTFKVEDAEECFQKAIDIARRQSAKSLELRATVSLARLWQQQGKSAEAHGVLAEIYSWFTEGFDTKDLQEAKALLEEL